MYISSIFNIGNIDWIRCILPFIAVHFLNSVSSAWSVDYFKPDLYDSTHSKYSMYYEYIRKTICKYEDDQYNSFKYIVSITVITFLKRRHWTYWFSLLIKY